MSKLKESLRKAGGFPTLLILVTIIFRIIDFSSKTLFAIGDTLVCVIALISGLVYAFNGYTKKKAMSYKTFMYLYAISSVFSIANMYYEIVDHLDSSKLPAFQILILVVHGLICVGILLLANVENLGKKASLGIAYAIVLSNIVLFARALIVTPEYIILTFSNLLLAVVASLFVNGKYIDKDSRGAK